jgi:hypothetical protein
MADERYERLAADLATGADAKKASEDALTKAPLETVRLLKEINESVKTLNDRLNRVIEVLEVSRRSRNLAFNAH